MRTREQWGAVHDYTTHRQVETPATQLFLHITVTRPSDHPDDDAHARYVERIGIRRFGIGISYNALVMPGGLLYEGQPVDRRGAHTVNSYGIQTCPTHGGSVRTRAGGTNLNYSARAIALARMESDPVTDADVEACAQWGASLIQQGHVIPDVVWHGHRDVKGKSCPGDKAYARIPDIQARMEELLEDEMQLPAERRADVQAMIEKGWIIGDINHYFPTAGQPSADLPVDTWLNVAVAGIGGAARLGTSTDISEADVKAIINGSQIVAP